MIIQPGDWFCGYPTRSKMLQKSYTATVLAVSASLLLIVPGIFFPDTIRQFSLWILAFSLLAIGIPHGAIDHIMAEKVYGLDKTWKGRSKFYAGYLGLMMLVGLLWMLNPLAGMLFFFAITVYHFGQADFKDVVSSGSYGFPWYLARGTLILGLIVFADTGVSLPIMAQALQIESAVLFSFLPDQNAALLILFAVYALSVMFGIFTGMLHDGWKIVADSALIILLFLQAGPLAGFATYFALWHSAGHVLEMQDYLKNKSRSMSLIQFYKAATPFTLVSLIGLVLLVAVNQAFGLEERFIALMFILISVLTLPHMVIVDRMHAQMRG